MRTNFLRFRQWLFKQGNEAYLCLLIAVIAITLMWSGVIVSPRQLAIGNEVKLPLLLLANLYMDVYLPLFWLSIVVAVIFGIAAFGMSFGKMKRVLIVLPTLVVAGFCGTGAFAWIAFSTQNQQDVIGNIEFDNHSYNLIHAYRSGDMILEADYAVLECDILSFHCSVVDVVSDYVYDSRQSKTASLYIDQSHNLYIIVGDESKLVNSDTDAG